MKNFENFINGDHIRPVTYTPTNFTIDEFHAAVKHKFAIETNPLQFDFVNFYQSKNKFNGVNNRYAVFTYSGYSYFFTYNFNTGVISEHQVTDEFINMLEEKIEGRLTINNFINKFDQSPDSTKKELFELWYGFLFFAFAKRNSMRYFKPTNLATFKPTNISINLYFTDINDVEQCIKPKIGYVIISETFLYIHLDRWSNKSEQIFLFDHVDEKAIDISDELYNYIVRAVNVKMNLSIPLREEVVGTYTHVVTEKKEDVENFALKIYGDAYRKILHSIHKQFTVNGIYDVMINIGVLENHTLSLLKTLQGMFSQITIDHHVCVVQRNTIQPAQSSTIGELHINIVKKKCNEIIEGVHLLFGPTSFASEKIWNGMSHEEFFERAKKHIENISLLNLVLFEIFNQFPYQITPLSR